MSSKKRRVLHHSRTFSVGLIVVSLMLLGLHTFAGDRVRIDNTSVLFLLIILLIPYLPWITRIKLGDFEAEIGREEIQEIKDKLDATTQQPTHKTAKDEAVDAIKDLAATDPAMALVRIRIAIEERLHSLVGIYTPEALEADGRRRLSISGMVHLLHKAQVIDESFAGALRDTISVANRAAHGEAVSDQNMERLIELGIRLIRSLDSLVIERALSSARKKIITQDVVEQKRSAVYELVTIVPFVDKPERRTYVLNQAELAEFFEVYEGVAEFVISLKEVTKRSPKKP